MNDVNFYTQAYEDTNPCMMLTAWSSPIVPQQGDIFYFSEEEYQVIRREILLLSAPIINIIVTKIKSKTLAHGK